MIYRVGIHYDAYAEAEVEADSGADAIDVAFENLDIFNFEGDYDVESVEEVKADK